MSEAQRRLELAREASAILRRANCDTLTGERKGHRYKRNKRAEHRIAQRLLREKQAKLGTFGAASPVRNMK